MSLSIKELRWKIFNVFPEGELALDHLLGLLSINYSRNIPSAAVKSKMPPQLLFNPEFIEKHCKTDEHLLMILMHEMYHVILGHTRLFSLITPMQNFAFDAVINSMICRSMPGYEYVSFFTGLYKDDKDEALLRPPENWSQDLGKYAHWKLKGDFLTAHKALYTEEGDLSYRDIFELVSQKTSGELETDLLGSHGDAEEIKDPDTIKVIAKIVRQWPAGEKKEGQGRGAELEKYIIELIWPTMDVSRVIRRAILAVALHSHGARSIYRQCQKETLLPYPTLPDRRATVMRSLGQHPVFFRGHIAQIHKETVGLVHVYLDVSGSMENYLQTIFSCLKPLRNHLYPILHIFSTEVIDCPIEEILKGIYSTTHGTDIDCVLEHVIKNKIIKAAIITDGYVGAPSEELMEKLPKQFKLVKLLTPEYYDEAINLLPGTVHRLPIEGVNGE